MTTGTLGSAGLFHKIIKAQNLRLFKLLKQLTTPNANKIKLTVNNENIFLRVSKQASADHFRCLANEVSYERTTTYGSEYLEVPKMQKEKSSHFQQPLRRDRPQSCISSLTQPENARFQADRFVFHINCAPATHTHTHTRSVDTHIHTTVSTFVRFAIVINNTSV